MYEYRRHTHARRGLLRMAPLSQSQSLGNTAGVVGSATSGISRFSSVGFGVAACERQDGEISKGRHLPPLGRKRQRPVCSPTCNLPGYESHRVGEAVKSRSFSSAVMLDGAITRVNKEWMSRVDIVVGKGEAAGITFKWTEVPEAGLQVLDVADGSVAEQHGGVRPGMLLVRINKTHVLGLRQEEVIQEMRYVAAQQRELTLAQIPVSLAAPVPCHNSAKEALPNKGWTTPVRMPRMPEMSPPSSSRMNLELPREAYHLQPLSSKYDQSSKLHSVLSSSDGYHSSGSVCTCLTSVNSWIAPHPNRDHYCTLYDGQQSRILTLRFVGSKEGTSLFDRDHTLGITSRDIEFVLGGSRSAEHIANSHRSLDQLTTDWRNDPYSTPARRRRLINDVCKIIVDSYTQAAAVRVKQLRWEAVWATRIQAASRMWAARYRYKTDLQAHRECAALSLQRSWLSLKARRRVWVLKEQRDRQQSEDAQKRRLAIEREEVIRREEMKREQRLRRTSELVVSLQRKVRISQALRRSEHAQRARRLLELRLRRSAILIQKALHLYCEASRLLRVRVSKSDDERALAASIRIKIAWQRHRFLKQNRFRHGIQNPAPASPIYEANFLHQGKISDQIEGESVTEHTQPTLTEEGSSALGATSGTEACDAKNPHAGKASLEARIYRGGANKVEVTIGEAEPLSGKPMGIEVTHDQISTLPQAGMMTVRVRIGNEEKDLMTPIVVAESESKHNPDMPMGADLPVDGKDDIENDAAHNMVSLRRQSVFPDTDMSRVTRVGVPTKSAKQTSARASTSINSTPRSVRSDDAVITCSRLGKLDNQEDEASGSQLEDIGAGGSFFGPLLSVGNSRTSRVPLENQKHHRDDGDYLGGTSGRYMEDSQVYLGCMVCGVKYLVEAVDASIPVSAGVQHTPEVLYLCTMCDGALRPGTDGRWMRRKRPSSAPAIGKRRLEHSDEAESSNIGDKEDQWRHRRMVCMNINREEAAAKLTFALCARRIQQVYQDYRHRQYLKGWALSLLRRWLLGRLKVRRCSRMCFRRRRAVAKIQSAARAASARARCSALLAARLQRWAECAAAITTEGYCWPSPLEDELCQESFQMPPPPPSSGQVQQPAKTVVDYPANIQGYSDRGLAEALAPTMGSPPPGCPSALAVDWGEWGEKLKLVFPPPTS